MRVDEFPVLIGELAIFNVNNPKNRRGDATFQCLQGNSFTAAQKNFLAAQCIGEIGDLPDICLGDSGNQLKRRYGLPFGTVNKWISNFKSPTAANIDGKCGRPLSLDQQGLLDLHKEVSQGVAVKGKGSKKNKKALFTGPELHACINKHYRMTLKRKGQHVHSDDEDIVLCHKTIKKLKKVFLLYI